MFKQSLAGSSLIALAQALAISDNLAAISQYQNLAQVGCDNHAASGCCMAMSSCGCDEEEELLAPPPLPPVDNLNLPPELGSVALNLDVLLTHIMHEVHPDPADIIMPEPDTPEERELIEEVISPIVIQLLNNDVAPAIPTCTLPGQQGSAYNPDENNADGVDVGEVFRGVIEEALKDYDVPAGVNFDDLVDSAIPAEDFMAQLDLHTDEGMQEVARVVESVRTALDRQNGIFEEDEAVEEVADALADDLEDAGLPADDFEEEIEDIVADVADN